MAVLVEHWHCALEAARDALHAAVSSLPERELREREHRLNAETLRVERLLQWLL